MSAQASVSLGMDEPEENTCFLTPGGNWRVTKAEAVSLVTASRFKLCTSSPCDFSYMGRGLRTEVLGGGAALWVAECAPSYLPSPRLGDHQSFMISRLTLAQIYCSD